MKINDLSLRSKIIFVVLLTISIMSMSLVLNMRVNNYALKIIGDSYKSNEELNSFVNDLAQVETSMELYIDYHSFESIDSYYNYNSRVKAFCDSMQQNPSSNELLQKNYIVNQIALSFLYYSGKTISARRGNDLEETNFYFMKTSECYNLLLSEISKLNNMLLEKNAVVYNADRKYIQTMTNASILFYIIFMVLIITLLYLMIDSITKPLADISKVALRVADRDFDVPLFNMSSKDEVGNITRAFDRMIISIREYIDTIWEKARAENEMKEKEVEMQALYADAQLRALQNQINPHFLFNTLNTGAQLAMMEEADKTCYFLEQVSDFFRYNIQQQKQTATISEELGLVDNFVYIMKVRFGQRLDFAKIVPEETFNEVLPTMTLQPLVENCIKHGLKNLKGCVRLEVKRNDSFVEITVSDNGSGITPEIRRQIFDAVEQEEITKINPLPVKTEDKYEHTGIGLVNVFYRLKLYFHREDIFDIQNVEEGTGTKFIIRIPKNV